MFGALAKTYYAEKFGIDPKSIYSVSIMPCTAKKFEKERPEMADSGQQDVDAVLTTRELGRMFREAGIDFADLEEENTMHPSVSPPVLRPYSAPPAVSWRPPCGPYMKW
jgi:NADP-reducing hydrogenase subunit HndD